MTERVLVLGGGMVGSVMAADLVRSGFQVQLADRSPTALERARARCGERLQTVEADLSDPAEVRRLAEAHDLCCGALSSHLGLAALRAVCEAGRPYADISFMAEDALELDALAQETGARAIVDCGVAPGMSNLLVGRAASRLDSVQRAEILVGGLPVERMQPFEYKAGFAPADVIEEYTRPARIIEGGRVVEHEALSGVELVDLPGLGTLEAFLTDGLRSLLTTVEAPFLIEKTMRYPGHAALMRAFREAGLFSKEPVELKGQSVVPLELTSQLLFPKWTYGEGEQDLTVMRITVDGEENGSAIRHRWTLVDRYSEQEAATSMSRTTALPCTAALRMLADGSWDRPGVVAPEALGADEALTARMLAELEERGVQYKYESAWL